MIALRRRRPAGPSAPDVPDLLMATPLSPPVPGRPVAWWALDDEGHDVVVQRVRPPSAPGGPDEATLRRRLGHPHVAPLLRVIRCPEGAVQVLGPVTHGCLADVLAERHLRAGEVVTLVAGLGSALEALHEDGFAHGELTAAGVLVDDGGMPLLLGLGAARPLPPAGRAQRRRELRGSGPVWGRAEDDVRALARLALLALGEPVSAALADLLTGVAEAPVGRAPSATQLARECWAVAPAETVSTAPAAGLDGPSGTAVTQRVRRIAARATVEEERQPRQRLRLTRWAARRPSRVAVTAIGAGAALAGAAALVLVLLPSAGSAGATVAPGPATDAVVEPAVDPRLIGDDPAAAVRALAELRVEAITAGDAVLLDNVDVPGSTAATADAALLESLAGSRVEDLAVDVVSAEVEQQSADEAQVAVVTAMSAYRRVTGSEVVDVPGGQPVTSRLVLHRDDGRWRVADSAP